MGQMRAFKWTQWVAAAVLLAVPVLHHLTPAHSTEHEFCAETPDSDFIRSQAHAGSTPADHSQLIAADFDHHRHDACPLCTLSKNQLQRLVSQAPAPMRDETQGIDANQAILPSQRVLCEPRAPPSA